MRPPVLISGSGSNPTPFSQPSRPTRPGGFIRVLVIVWVLGGLIFLAVKLLPIKSDPVPPPAVPAAKSAVTAISNEDLLRHMEAVNRKLGESAAKIRRAEAEIDRTVPALDRNYLPVESQRLKSAATAAESARRDLEDSREEFQLVLNSIRKDDRQ